MDPKTVFLLFSLLLCSSGVHAQTKIGFSYDAAGNRIKREIIMSQNQSQSNSRSAFYSDMVADQQVKISPNPTKGKLRIEVLNVGVPITGEIIVFSSNGAKVASSPLVSNVANVDISTTANGVYILRVNIGDSFSSWKIIKE